MKALKEFFKCYPVTDVVLEDVKFNHRDKRWGKNFSTVEIGNTMIYSWIQKRAHLYLCSGIDTQDCRKRYGYSKSRNKSAETFNSHCSDALALAVHIYVNKRVVEGYFIVVDDIYRCVRRRLHDTQFSKKGVRDLYSSGNFRGIRKGAICEFGQICGGTKNKVFIINKNNKRINKIASKIRWMSHNFKNKTQCIID